MRLVMTMMVRDEADIIKPMLDHHLAQGIDHFVVTDNGSVDGTAEILEDYRERGIVDLRHDPVHRKQQSATVTAMARDAYSLHGATWVLNADADEFWVPLDRSTTLAVAVGETPTEVGAFEVPVVDMTGAPALAGSGLNRLRYRDSRPVESLRAIGLHAHATPDVIHVGSADVEVVQGNHFVNIPSSGAPKSRHALEVLHLPWRSWDQYKRKVENAGRAYEGSDLTPSPNHHGMRDWRRHVAGSLFALYVGRHPSEVELREGIASGHLIEDHTLLGLEAPVSDLIIGDAETFELRRVAASVIALEHETARLESLTSHQSSSVDGLADELRMLRGVSRASRMNLTEATRRLTAVSAELQSIKNRRVVRLADRLHGLRAR